MVVLKILLLFIAVQGVISKTLLFKEINMKRNFEFSLKPIQFKPITFIKEIWTPLGLVGKKHAIVRRSPEEGSPVLPIKHEKEESKLHKIPLEKSFEAVPPVLPPLPHKLPPHIPPPVENEVSKELPKPIPVAQPPPVIYTVGLPKISTTVPPSFGSPRSVEVFGPSSTPVPPLGPVIPGPVPEYFKPSPLIRPSPVEVIAIGEQAPKPIPGPPPPAEIRDVNAPLSGGLLTDITRADKINAYLKAVDGLPLIKPPLEENLLPGNSIEAEAPKDSGLSGSLVKGSRLALYFGNILLQVMSEVISSARSAISQYSKPAPI